MFVVINQIVVDVKNVLRQKKAIFDEKYLKHIFLSLYVVNIFICGYFFVT